MELPHGEYEKAFMRRRDSAPGDGGDKALARTPRCKVDDPSMGPWNIAPIGYCAERQLERDNLRGSCSG